MADNQTNLEHPADIDTTPEKAVVDFLISRKIQSEIVKKLPNWDVPSDSPDINLVVATRELAEAKQILSNEKAVYDVKTKEMEEKWEELRLNETNLAEEFKKNDKVIKNNYKERKKLEKQITEEMTEQERIQVDINDLEKKLQHYETAEAKIREKVSMLKIYEDFLQKVVDEYPEFSCIDDVLNRYESLIESRDEMKELYLKNVKLVENVRKEVEDLTEEGMKLMLNLSKSLHKLRMEEYFVQKELCHWAHVIEQLRDMGNKDYYEVTNAVERIWLLYLNVCRARNQDPKLDKSNLKAQLEYIVENVYLMKYVVEESRTYLRKCKLERKEQAVPSKRDLDTWSTDYEDFQSVRSNRAQASNT